MKKDDDDLLGCIGALVSLPLLIAFAILANGLVLTKLWEWFMVPTFGLPQLSIPAALGLAMIVQFMVQPYYKDDTAADFTPGQKVVYAFAKVSGRSLYYLSMGWIILRLLPA